MKTITITIQVPDGVNVNVSGGQQRSTSTGSSGSGDFVQRPDPDFPEDACQVCGNEEWRLIKAGYSKTKKNADGSPKRFNAFYVCGTEGCDGKPEQGDSLPF
jgi:hypothetical protein